MTEQTDDPFTLLLDEQWNVEPGDYGDIRNLETVLARMPGLLLAAVPRGGGNLTLTNTNAD
jgi:hypothetical protein